VAHALLVIFMTITRTILAGLTGLILAVSLRADDSRPTPPAVTLKHTEQRTLRSTATGTTHRLSINLPADYATSGKTYPVLYVLDGTWNFAMLAGIQDSLYYGRRIPAVITVALDYDLSYGELLQRRERDFTPSASEKHPGSGQAPELLAFFETELIPFIDHTYRTDPQNRALLGHSYGGLFGVYAWVERPRLFQRIAASSPSLHWDDEVLTRRIKDGRHPPADSPARLHLAVGGDEHPDHVAAILRFAEQLRQTPPPSDAWTCALYPDENHTSMKPRGFADALVWIYRS
jgi:uncharacterized protein